MRKCKFLIKKIIKLCNTLISAIITSTWAEYVLIERQEVHLHESDDMYIKERWIETVLIIVCYNAPRHSIIEFAAQK